MKMVADKPDESMAEENSESKKYEQHEIEDAANTLTKAEKIKSNKTLHGHAMKHMSTMAGHMNAAMKGHEMGGKKPGSLKELRDLASKKSAAIVDEN
jgi:hypothetical protein